MQNIIMALLALIITSISQDAFAVDGESIVFNPTTGNYLITHYSDIDRKYEQLVFVPATKINPIVRTRLNLGRKEEIHYGYTLTSGGNSQQVIRRFQLNPVSSVTTPLPDIPLNAPPGKIMEDMMNAEKYFDTPPLWNASLAYSDGQMSFRVGWYYNANTGGLSPGSKAGFGFKSRDLPGIIQAEVHGYAPDSQKIDGEENPDEEDGGFGQQYFSLLRNNFLLRTVAAPTIAVPAPFDAAILLDRIRTEMQTWPGKQLLDASYSSKLDGYLSSAANAFRMNQPKAAREQIETVRRLLDHEHRFLDHDDEDNDDTPEHKAATRLTIDRLAARVLDLDLRYVLKRTEKEHEHEHEDGDSRKERDRK